MRGRLSPLLFVVTMLGLANATTSVAAPSIPRFDEDVFNAMMELVDAQQNEAIDRILDARDAAKKGSFGLFAPMSAVVRTSSLLPSGAPLSHEYGANYFNAWNSRQYSIYRDPDLPRLNSLINATTYLGILLGVYSLLPNHLTHYWDKPLSHQDWICFWMAGGFTALDKYRYYTDKVRNAPLRARMAKKMEALNFIKKLELADLHLSDQNLSSDTIDLIETLSVADLRLLIASYLREASKFLDRSDFLTLEDNQGFRLFRVNERLQAQYWIENELRRSTQLWHHQTELHRQLEALPKEFAKILGHPLSRLVSLSETLGSPTVNTESLFESGPSRIQARTKEMLEQWNERGLLWSSQAPAPSRETKALIPLALKTWGLEARQTTEKNATFSLVTGVDATGRPMARLVITHPQFRVPYIVEAQIESEPDPYSRQTFLREALDTAMRATPPPDPTDLALAPIQNQAGELEACHRVFSSSSLPR